MIDWKRRCLELATVVDRERRERMHSDMKLGWEMAKELIELEKREDKARKKFLEHWKCTDRKESKRLYEEYLELIQ